MAMTKKIKALIALLIIAVAISLLWNKSVSFLGFATPGTCEVKKGLEVTQLSISETELFVDTEINAKRKLAAESINCTLWPSFNSTNGDLNLIGLVDAAQFMWDNVDARFGYIPFGGFGPGGIDTGHSKTSSHYEGRAIDFFFKPHKNPEKVATGWTFANWAVANADRLGIATVIYQDRIWSRNSSFKGWEVFVPSYGNPENPTIRHLDHVHVDVS